MNIRNRNIAQILADKAVRLCRISPSGPRSHGLAFALASAAILLLGQAAQAQSPAGQVNTGTGAALPTTNGVVFSARSQTVITVPPAFSGTIVTSNRLQYWGPSNGAPVTLNLSGVPANLSIALATNGWTGTNNLNTLFMTNVLTGVAKGVWTYSLAALADNVNGIPTNYLNYRVQVANIWNGTTNAVQDGPSDWNTAGNWLGGVPGATDDVVFSGQGAATNISVLNVSIPTDVEVASLRFSQTNTPGFHNIQIAAGKTLKVTGINGLSIVKDVVEGISGPQGNGGPVGVFFAGSQGATLFVSNKLANIATTEALANTGHGSLNMTNLDNFVADVNRIGLEDYQSYPDYINFNYNNNYGGNPRQQHGVINLARTNRLQAAYKDPNNYNDQNTRNYAITIQNIPVQGGNPIDAHTFGLTNAFLADSICFGHENSGFGFAFRPQFATNFPFALHTNQQYAFFRSTNSDRMSMFAVADDGGTNWAQTNVKPTTDFGSFNGNLDLMVDRFIIARDRSMIVSNNTPSVTGVFIMGKGIADINTAILGYQEHDSKTNWNALSGTSQPYLNWCQGLVTVSNGGTFKVNRTLTLGFTADTNPVAQAVQTSTRGTISVGTNSTLIVSNVVVDPGLGMSTGNAITLSGASLIISNVLGSSAGGAAGRWLDNLAMNNSSTLTLHVDCNNPNPYAYVSNLTTSGGAPLINIAQVNNLAGVEIPIISYYTGGPSFVGQATMPPKPNNVPALNGVLRKDETVTPHILYLDILTNAPKNLRWAGTGASANWDSTNKVWADLDHGGNLTNFLNGDHVILDDTASATNVVIADNNLIPGSITMTNSTKAYVFTAANGGNLNGTALFNKWGSVPLEIEAPTTVSLLVNQGSLIGGPPSGSSSASIGSATIAAGASMVFSGTIIAGVSCAGTAVISGGTAGIVAVLTPSGILTNSGTITGTPSLGDGALLVNTGNINFSGGNINVVSNALFINTGFLNGDNITVNGTMKDNYDDHGGTITLTTALTVNNRGRFYPGGDTGRQTLVIGDSSGGTNAGRILLAQGSTNVFKVDPSNPSTGCTVLYSSKMDFGANSTSDNNNGCTLLITNTTLNPFLAGQSFRLFVRFDMSSPISSTGQSQHTYPVFDPGYPALGLAWDLSQLWNASANNPIKVRGPVNTTPINTAFDSMLGLGTNYTTNVVGVVTNITTNRVIGLHFHWPSDHTGWSLYSQNNTGTVGLSTNWNLVFGSMWTNDVYITNTITKNDTGTLFYRMSYP